MIGSGDDDETECRVLNRITRICSDGWEYEGDQRHAVFIVKSMDMQGAKFVTTLGEDAWKEKGRGESSVGQRTRTLAPTVGSESQLHDTGSQRYTICSEGDVQGQLEIWRQLNRLARYLKGRPRVISRFPFQPRQSAVTDFQTQTGPGAAEPPVRPAAVR